MSKLPKILETQNYINTKLPSGKSIGLRGWKVKDEKEILFALDSDTNAKENKIHHLMKFLRNCCDNQKLFDQLSEVDLRKIAVEVRKLSKGNTISYVYTCQHPVSGAPNGICGNKIQDEIKFTEVEEIKPFDVSPAQINDKLMISYKDLSYKDSLKIYDAYGESLAKYTYFYMVNSIEAIVYDNVSYTEFSEADMDEFLEQFDSDTLEKINEEFEKRASDLTLKRKIKCRKCGTDIDVNFGDLYSFLLF